MKEKNKIKNVDKFFVEDSIEIICQNDKIYFNDEILATNKVWYGILINQHFIYQEENGSDIIIFNIQSKKQNLIKGEYYLFINCFIHSNLYLQGFFNEQNCIFKLDIVSKICENIIVFELPKINHNEIGFYKPGSIIKGINFLTNEFKWEYDIGELARYTDTDGVTQKGGHVSGDMQLCENLLIAPCTGGNLIALHADTGQLAWHKKLKYYQIKIFNNFLYVFSRDGLFKCNPINGDVIQNLPVSEKMQEEEIFMDINWLITEKYIYTAGRMDTIIA